MELIPVQAMDTTRDKIAEERKEGDGFIEANTTTINLTHLKRDCIIPVFSKDNETTISHQQFIETMQECTAIAFPKERVGEPDIKVSHTIKGRIPEAIGKAAKELLKHEKTIYYERMAFTIEIPTIQENINGNTLSLTVGGVRAYNHENLYSRKSLERFKVFIGFKNHVCTNLCVSTDGFSSEIRASNTMELQHKIMELIQQYNAQEHLNQMATFGDYELTEQQFAQFIGKARLYQYLPKEKKAAIPLLELNDGQISFVVRNYYEDNNFRSADTGSINLWKLYNLFTGSTKSSYIDTFLERTVNTHQLTVGLVDALNCMNKYQWFLC